MSCGCPSIQSIGAAASQVRIDLHSQRSRLELAFHRPRKTIPVDVAPPDRWTCSIGFLRKITSSLAGNSSSGSTGRGRPGNPLASSIPSPGGGGSGGYDRGSGDFGFHEHDGWNCPSSRRFPLDQCREEEEERASSPPSSVERIRSFYCVNVGPVLDDRGWREAGSDDDRPCLIPCYIEADITASLVRQGRCGDGETLSLIKEDVENWYHSQGFVLAKVRSFAGSTTGLLCCKISEGTITDTRVCFMDEDGREIQGRTTKGNIFRELPRTVMEGMPYNTNAIKQALYNLRQLQLFDKINIDIKRNRLDGISLKFVVQEVFQDACSFQTGLSFFSSDSGKPILASIRPAGTLSVEHRNIAGKNRTLHGYIDCNDLLRPQDDSRFKLEYIHPYADRSQDKVFRIGCYNSRKLTAVISHPGSQEQEPAVWVDRAGFKSTITDKFSRRSKLTYGFVLEEVSTRDVLGSIRIHDDRDLLSDGIDRVPFLHVKLTRDNTRLVHGSRVGAIDTFQVDQGVGFGNNAAFLFNKHLLSTTRNLALPSETPGSFPLLILRARYGGIIGDAPSYQSFANPRSGESCSNFLELMSETRIPIPRNNNNSNYAYSFVESFTSLDGGGGFWQSSGVLVGLGVKTGEFRTEYVFDSSTRTGSLNVQMGERC